MSLVRARKRVRDTEATVGCEVASMSGSGVCSLAGCIALVRGQSRRVGQVKWCVWRIGGGFDAFER